MMFKGKMKKRRKRMNKKEIEGIEKVIKEYLKKNLRLEPRVKYIDEYSLPEKRIIWMFTLVKRRFKKFY